MGDIRRFVALLTGLCAVLALLAIPARARSQTIDVEIHSNFFFPNVIRVSAGDTVRWTAHAQGHTVTSDDQRFSWPPGNRTMERGDSVSLVFARDEVFAFYCKIHGAPGGSGGTSNMVGRVLAGTAGRDPVLGGGTRTVPSAAYPTLRSALTGLTQWTRIELQPGTYSNPPDLSSSPRHLPQASIAIDQDHVEIVGLGASPGDVKIDGLGVMNDGILVTASHARIRNLSIVNHRESGVAVRTADGAVLIDAVLRDNGRFGVVATRSRLTSIFDTTISNASHSGVMAHEGSFLLSDSTVERSLFGVVADSVTEGEVRRSTIRDNGTGIAIRAVPESAGSSKMSVLENTITGSGASIASAGPLDFSVRSGVYVNGAVDVTIDFNTIDGGDYGVLIASSTRPAIGVRVSRNTVTAAANAGFGFDGHGFNVCLDDNTLVSTRPVVAEIIYSCALPATIGIPDPSVIADHASYASSA